MKIGIEANSGVGRDATPRMFILRFKTIAAITGALFAPVLLLLLITALFCATSGGTM